jgi:hypothetical protein
VRGSKKEAAPFALITATKQPRKQQAKAIARRLRQASTLTEFRPTIVRGRRGSVMENSDEMMISGRRMATVGKAFVTPERPMRWAIYGCPVFR